MNGAAGGDRARRRAVVIGGGLAGMLAAAAVIPFADDVTIVERDALPAQPASREGLPQGHHAHVLMSGGAKAIEMLLPGTLDRWADAGASKIPLPSGVAAYASGGWSRQWRAAHYLIACSREILDWHLRDLLLADPRIRLLAAAQVRALTGSARRITGVQVASREGLEWCIDADLVIDASGRHSQVVDWLTALSITGVPERHLNSGLVCASRIYRALTKNDGAPMVQVASAPHTPGPRQAGTLIPIEKARWMVTLTGSGDAAPTDRNDAFVPTALQLPHPMIGQLIARATPLTDVHVSNATGNSRRYFEAVPHWPDGLVVVGDAAATCNPAYGQGMSVAALQACELLRSLAATGLCTPGAAHRAQKELARPTNAAWSLATSYDAMYPHTGGAALNPTGRAKGRYLSWLSQAASASARAAAALTQVTTMETSLSRLLRPGTLLAASRGLWAQPMTTPPLTDAQRTLLNPDGPT
ncbi:FAD-dependent monooxygenase [Streptomyces avermitilis]|uniref:FAD-dependent monooxygenase n=1 Tax=Streptomyces avermitilis TaxID=33903 RepID=UPI0033D9BC93